MFVRIRNRLTVLYSGVMVLFLLALTGISFTVLSWLTYYDLKQELKVFARHEFEEYYDKLNDYNDDVIDDDINGENKPGEKTGDYTHQKDHDKSTFYYVLSSGGELIDSDEIYPSLRGDVLQRVQDWRPQSGDMRLEIFRVSDGREIYLAIDGQAAYKDGRFLGVVYAGKDVTYLYRLMKQLLVVLAGLSVFFLFLASLTGHFLAGRAMVPIMQAFARQRQFLADASHELRTPLSVLQSSLEVVQGEDGSCISSFSRQVLDDMMDEVKRMTGLVSNLLTLARADSGAVELTRETFDLSQVAGLLVRSLQHLAAKKQTLLQFEGPETLPVYADRERLAQLIGILLDNGIKYTPEGGMVLFSFGVASIGSKKFLNISVRDTGIGIAANHLERIFDRFYRIDKGRSREMGGTGLGLSIAKWIAEAHGGTIKVESVSAEGSTFTVTLPCTV